MFIEESPTRVRNCTWMLLLLCLPVASPTEGATREEVAEAVRSGYASWDSGDVDAILNMHDPKAVGFGYRTAPGREWSTLGEEENKRRLERFYEQMEYYSIELEELHTSVEGDVGLAWGVHVEDYKVKGRPPEKARVRFTLVLRNSAEGWRRVLYHRDIQPFDEHGRYLIEHTKASHDK